MEIETPDSQILSLASAMAGEDADTAVLSALCAAAAAELSARLREGLSPAALGQRFVTAAGVLALGMYCAVEDPASIRSFRAGELNVEYGAPDAAELRAAAERLLFGALRDSGFGFRGVTG